MMEGWFHKKTKVDEDGIVHKDVEPAMMSETGVIAQPGETLAEVKAKMRKQAEEMREAA